MTARPYTDEDLRDEAARQHYTATTDPDFMGVGEQMQDSPIGSTTAFVDTPIGPTWGEALGEEAFDSAQRQIHKLINNAADVSDWAVALGADGLEPDDSCLSLGADERPIVRIHFAFEPGMPEEMRQDLIQGVGEEIAKYL